MMNRWKRKRKEWLDRKSRKGNQQKNLRKSVCREYVSTINRFVSHETARNRNHVVTLKPPKIFSLVNNTEETMTFFTSFANEINRGQSGLSFFVDSSDVESATVDALIYLIAILQNDAVNAIQHYKFAGNYPVNEKARKIYIESGFNDYVDSRMKKLPGSNDKKRITCGIKNDSAASRELCDFIIKSLGKTRRDILPIQKVMIELMSNVYHHAYEKNNFMAKKWYMYAEHSDNCVRCVFVDTGLGIAKTARKKFREKLREFFHVELDDSKIIKSIFNGDFRTATNEQFRGNGLSSVRENIKADIFESFEVISGRGRCTIPKVGNTDDIFTYCYGNRLYGTLFQFVIR